MPIRDQKKRRAYFREWQRIRREASQEALIQYKLARGCSDCGYRKDHRALQFDHLPGTIKLATVPRLAGSNEKAMWKELLKCDVVCANCHCIRTANRKRADS